MDGWGVLMSGGGQFAVFRVGGGGFRWGVRVTGWMVWMRGMDMGGVLEARRGACGGRHLAWESGCPAAGWMRLCEEDAPRSELGRVSSPHGGGRDHV